MSINPDTELLPYEKEVNVIGRYILSHPYWERAFPNSSREDVIKTLVQHCKDERIRVAFGPEGEIIGVIMYEVRDASVVHVSHLIGTHMGIVEAAFNLWREIFPEHTVHVIRRGKLRIYEPQQFLNRN